MDRATDSPVDNASPGTHWVAPLTAGTVGGCAAIVSALGVWICTAGNPYVRGVDMNVVFSVQKTLRGAPLYTDPGDVPFDVTQYNPLYYLICLAVAQATDTAAGDPAGVTLVCRAVSLLAGLSVAGVSFATTRRVVGVRPGYAAASAGFGLVVTSPWYFLARPDALMALFMFASFAAVLRAADPGTHRKEMMTLAAVVLGCGAAYAKQNGAQAVGIILLYLLYLRQFRLLAMATVAVAVTAATAAGVSKLIWPHLMTNVVAGVDNGVNLQNAFDKTYRVFFSNFAPVVGVSLLLLYRWAGPVRDHRKAFFVVALPVLFLFATVTGLKFGSAENYYNEFLYAAAMAFALFLDSPGPSGAEADGPGARRMAVHLTVAYLIGILPFWTVSQAHTYWWGVVDPKVSLVTPVNSFQADRFQQLTSYLREELADDPDALVMTFERAVNVHLPERCVIPQEEIAGVMYERKLLDYSTFQRYVKEGRVRYIVADHATPPPDSFLGADLRRFGPPTRVGTFNVYKYKTAN